MGFHKVGRRERIYDIQCPLPCLEGMDYWPGYGYWPQLWLDPRESWTHEEKDAQDHVLEDQEDAVGPAAAGPPEDASMNRSEN